MKRSLILTTALALLSAAAEVACSDASTNYGVPDNLSCQNPATAVPVDGGGGGGSSGGGGSGADAGSREAGEGDAGCTGADGGCPTFTNDIYPLMTGTWACTSSSCHGGVYPPIIDPSVESKAYQALSAFSPSYCPTLPFIHSGSKDPAATSFMPVLTGTSCGAQMPEAPGQMGADDMCVVQAWIACGMPEN